MSFSNESSVQKSSFDVVSICGLAGGVIYALGVFLPYVTVSFLGMSQSVSLIQGGGITWIIILLLGLGSALLSLMRKALPAGICGVIALFYAFIGFAGFKSKLGSMGSFEAKLTESLMSYSIGFYCLWIGSILVIAAGFYAIVKARK